MLAELRPDLAAGPAGPFSGTGFAAVAAAVLGPVGDGEVGFALEVVGLAFEFAGLEAEQALAVEAAEAGLLEVAGLEADDAAFAPAAGGAVGFVPSGFAAVFCGFGAVWVLAAPGVEGVAGFAAEAVPPDPDFAAAG
jgi:hypothetical protein